MRACGAVCKAPGGSNFVLEGDQQVAKAWSAWIDKTLKVQPLNVFRKTPARM